MEWEEEPKEDVDKEKNLGEGGGEGTEGSWRRFSPVVSPDMSLVVSLSSRTEQDHDVVDVTSFSALDVVFW